MSEQNDPQTHEASQPTSPNQSQSPSATIEDYLWLIFTLERDGEEVIGARLADLLEVTAPTVTVTLKRMIRDGWIEMDANKHIHLTAEGNEAAKTVLRRHMLVEWLLAEMLNVPWSKLHHEAHQLEHYISAEVEDRLMRQLGSRPVCPHGNPIPGNEDFVRQWASLLDAPLNTPLIIRRVHEHAESRLMLMNFLEEHKLLPGSQVTVREKLPFNETLTLEVNGQTAVLGYRSARQVFAEIL